MSPKPTHKLVGAHIEDLADGRTLAPGATVTLDRAAVADPHNARLIDEGLLLELPAEKSRGEENA